MNCLTAKLENFKRSHETKMDYSKQIIADKKQEEKSHLKTATLKRQTLEEFFQFWQEGKKKERNFKGLTDEQQEKIKDQETQLMCRD